MGISFRGAFFTASGVVCWVPCRCPTRMLLRVLHCVGGCVLGSLQMHNLGELARLPGEVHSFIAGEAPPLLLVDGLMLRSGLPQAKSCLPFSTSLVQMAATMCLASDPPVPALSPTPVHPCPNPPLLACRWTTWLSSGVPDLTSPPSFPSLTSALPALRPHFPSLPPSPPCLPTQQWTTWCLSGGAASRPTRPRCSAAWLPCTL